MNTDIHIHSILHDDYLNPWYIYQKPEPEDTLLAMHCGNCDEPNAELTFESHADTEALLEAAVRTSLPLSLVHLTVLVVDAHVDLLVLHRALEEPFTQHSHRQHRARGRQLRSIH